MSRKRQKWFGASAVYDGEGAQTRFLLIRHAGGRVGFAGGMRGDDKTAHATAVRETREETGLKLKKDAVPEAVFTFPGSDHRKVFHLFHISAFEGELLTEPHDDGGEEIQAFWEHWDRAIPILSYAHKAAAEDFVRHMGLVA